MRLLSQKYSDYLRQMSHFGVLWTAYASTYLLRKPIGVVKISMADDLLISPYDLGWMDTAFALPYAVVQMLFGGLGDMFPPQSALSTALLLASLSMITFGHWSSLHMAVCLLAVNGAAQAVCWPCCTKLLSCTYKDNAKKKTKAVGLLGTSAFAGGVIGTAFSVYLQDMLGWRGSFTAPSLIVGSMGLSVMILSQTSFYEIPKSYSAGNGDTPSLKTIIKLPGVPYLALAVFSLKMVRYSLYMWLPVFLEKELKYSQVDAGLCSTVFEIGGVIGTALSGPVIDRCFCGNTMRGTTFLVGLSGIPFILFAHSALWGMRTQLCLLSLAGAFNCAPDCMLAGSISTDIGEGSGRNAGAAVTGFVNGFGSFGAVLEGPLIGYLSARFGWSIMSHLMVFLSCLSTVFVIRVMSLMPSSLQL